MPSNDVALYGAPKSAEWSMVDPASNATLAGKGLLPVQMRRFDEAAALLKRSEAQEATKAVARRCPRAR